MRILAITTMRNEAPFILEWIAYHQHIGVTDFLIYSNDCDDGTDALLDRLNALGIVTHERNHSRGKKSVQWRALNKASRHALTKAADWIFVTDVDEFLCIHAGDGTIGALLDASPQADGFMIPWRMFGNSGIVRFTDAPILSQFTQSGPDALLWPWRAAQFKSLFHNGPDIDRLGVHRPIIKEGAKPRHWVDGNGDTGRAMLGTINPSTGPRYKLAQINHYALGAMESFLVKVQRGKPNHTNDAIDLSYWVDRNLNTVTDTRILRHHAQVTARRDRLLEDAQIAELHHKGVVWRKASIAALRKDFDSFYLLSRLIQVGPTQILPMAQQIAQFRGLLAMRAAQLPTSDK